MEVNEIWKPVVGYEGLYEISNIGRVKSLEKTVNTFGGHTLRRKERFLRPQEFTTGYYFVILCDNTQRKHCSIHRLVADAFIPNPEKKPDVNHKDFNRKNNLVENLEWVTKRENIVHAFTKVDRNTARGERNSKAKLKESDAIEIRKLKREGVDTKRLAEIYQLNCSTINRISNGTYWKHVESI